ncbi:MAG: type II toxin-antitoxin system HicA family toxin [Syntrophales bacterium]
MKRNELLKHLRRYGCFLKREGSAHSLWINPNTGKIEAVPRHTEISDRLAI